MSVLSISMLPGENWYGICTQAGLHLPFTGESEFHMDLDPNPTGNQAASLLLSDAGRYVYCSRGMRLDIAGGVICAACDRAEVIFGEGHATLRGAFLAASSAHFPAGGVMPPEDFFSKPQYNTWIELLYDQTQEGILRYARAILEQGLPAGILMIDDGWNPRYGHFEFTRAFPDPKAMVDELHAMGFTVMLWTCPFISPDSLEYRTLRDRDLLLKDREGNVAIRSWWNGCSAVLDLTHPGAREWFHARHRALMENYGIDGFKFDAGDGQFYRNDDITYAPTDANGQTQVWMEVGACYPYNEYRAGFGMQGLPLVHRLADKHHSWDENGVAALVPNELCQGILGYPFTCPDMIGGGEYQSFSAHSANLDAELFVRYAQCAALMPMMQFSAAPWRVLPPEYAALCVDAARLHLAFAPRIKALAREAAATGEPIVRYMEYQFPGEGMACITDQFMLGSDVLAAPVLEKGARTRQVCLPRGTWRYADGTVFEGGQTVTVDAPLHVLPYFIREEA